MESDGDGAGAGGSDRGGAGGADPRAGDVRYVDVLEYRVSALPFDLEDDGECCLWDVYVVNQGRDRWSVHRFFRQYRLNRLADEWVLEMRPSEREDEWIEEHTFKYEEAMAAAARWAGEIEVNGITAKEHARRRAERCS